MQVKRVVTCLPVKNLQTSSDFYSHCFELSEFNVEEDIVTVGIANLDVFLIAENEFAGYLETTRHTVHFPKESSQVIFSLAVESRDEIEEFLSNAEKFGGKVAQPLQYNKWQQLTCFVQDPDGHLFEIVLLKKN